MDKTELSILLANSSQFLPPNLIDDEMAELVAQRGKMQARLNTRILIVVFVIALVAGFIGGMAHVSTTPIVVIGLAVGWVIGALRTAAIARAYKRRQYDLVSRMLPGTIWLNALWYPFSYFQIVQCQQMQFEMLILEGRLFELELVNRFAWAASERRAVRTGVPKNWAVANNLAISWLIQGRYAQAAEMFSNGLARKQQTRIRLTLLNNLAYCQCQDGQLDACERNLNEAFKLLGSDTTAPVSPRLRYVRALLYFERGDLAAADTAIEEALDNVKAKNFPIELQGNFTVLLGQIRHKQGRLDEAELHFRNSVDIMASADNPDYIKLSECLWHYAQLLLDAGKIESAQRALEKACRYNDFYIEREKRTVADVKARLQNRKMIRSGADLLTLSGREKLLEVRES